MTDAITDIDTLVVGAGQAGIAMSEHLSALNIPHLVVEKNRIAEAWRSGRWDSLVANGPAWHDRFPGMRFDADPDSFIPKEGVADYFARYAEKFNAPVRTGVTVQRVTRNAGRAGFTVETSAGAFQAQRVVAASGPFHRPLIPAIAPTSDVIHQLHSADYKNPQQLPEGAVLVVGAGSSGVQIADELQRAGRQVWLSVGPHDRPPRAYRGRDYCWWLGVLGLWDAATKEPHKEHVTIAVSGARGGETIDFRRLAHQGIRLTGVTRQFKDGNVQFADDLQENIRLGDENYLSVLAAADEWIANNGADLPEEPEARRFAADPECLLNPVRELNLADEGIHTIIWATGYATDYSWLGVNCFDEQQRPVHHRGVAKEPGIYFLGLPWLSRRGSTFIWGVWHDAKYIADQIAIQRNYAAYKTNDGIPLNAHQLG
ncbi:NAD(P)/FAD-dependent oxidoreductase [Pantoea sp.]|uniref:flavin-containing monooxygenase n=1 Tax=Pantoea sp. TaxID=69393 RepID=UPI0028974033|nr:NAD(P)/FAD-dependent oxidoreductase [Pantoea sp.]